MLFNTVHLSHNQFQVFQSEHRDPLIPSVGAYRIRPSDGIHQNHRLLQWLLYPWKILRLMDTKIQWSGACNAPLPLDFNNCP